jgi:hypothetical protein
MKSATEATRLALRAKAKSFKAVGNKFDFIANSVAQVNACEANVARFSADRPINSLSIDMRQIEYLYLILFDDLQLGIVASRHALTSLE